MSVSREVAGQRYPVYRVTALNAAGRVLSATYGNGLRIDANHDASGRLVNALSNDLATRFQGGPGGGGYIDPASLHGSGGPPSQQVPLPWVLGVIALSLIARIGWQQVHRGEALPLVLIVLTDGAVLALLLSPQAVQALSMSYHYDTRGNVQSRQFDTDLQSFNHDLLDRLTQELGTALPQSYSLDGNGNRLSDGQGAYVLLPNSNRLTQSPQGAAHIDPAGYTLADSHYRYTGNAAGDLAEVRAGEGSGLILETMLGEYRYDHRHLRVVKTANGLTTHYHYDPSGQLIAETSATGQAQKSYVWFSGRPVAMIDHAAPYERTYYIETDALFTPRSATDDAGQEVWRWTSDAFGVVGPDSDFGNAPGTEINLRFPGQYFDPETGLHYNWHRYYQPWTGRYLSSDPIGLWGGANTFGYAYSQPVKLTDRFGLAATSFLICTGVNAGKQLYDFYSQLRELTESTKTLMDLLEAVDDRIEECPSEDTDRLEELWRLRNRLQNLISKNISNNFSPWDLALPQVAEGMILEAGVCGFAALPWLP